MSIPLVDLKKQYQALREEINSAIGRVLDGMQLFLGENVQALEEDFARYCGTPFAVRVGSGTEALHLALRGCGIGPGDEVITVSHTFIATVEAIAQVGAVPVFVDIDPETYNLDPHQIEAKITPRTRAIMPVHLYGHPAEMKPILDIAQRYDLWVIEDACQAHGALYHGRRAGSLGDVGCFSFYYTKNLGGYGEGGMAVTHDPRIAETMRLLRNHGSRTKYEHILMGVNGRLDEIQAAIIRVKLRYLDQWNQRRRHLAQVYNENLPSWVVKPVERPHCQHVYHLYVIRTPQRDELREWLKKNDIDSAVHYPIPIHQQKAVEAYQRVNGILPVTERAIKDILSLPLYPELEEEQVRYICSRIREFSPNGLKNGARKGAAFSSP